MKKFIFAMFVAVATLACFSSCSDDKDDIQVSDLNGNTFEGEDVELGSTYSISFDATTFSFSVDGVQKGTGSYTVADNTVSLNYTAGDYAGKKETMTGDGSKKLVYAGVTLKKK